MADGTSVGKLTLDLEIRDKVAAQLEELKNSISKMLSKPMEQAAEQAAESVQKGMEKAAESAAKKMEEGMSGAVDSVKNDIEELAREAAKVKVPQPSAKPQQKVVELTGKSATATEMGVKTEADISAAKGIEAAKKQAQELKELLKAIGNYEVPADPVERLEQQLENTKEKISLVQAKWQELNAALSSAQTDKEAAKLVEQINAAEKQLISLQTSAESTQSKIESAEESAGETAAESAQSGEKSAGKMKAAFSKAAGGVKKVFGGALNTLRGGFSKLRSAGGKALDGIKAKFSGLKRSASGVSSPVQKLGRSIRSAAKSALLMAGLYAAFRGMKSAMQEACMGNEQFSKSLNEIKANLSIAFQPIMQAVMPAINSMMAGLAAASKALATFTAEIFGSTYKKSMEAAKKVKEVGKEAKKNSAYLASFDEMNVAQDTQSESDESGESVIDWSAINGEGAELPDWAEKMKAAIKAGDWQGAGKQLGAAVNSMVEKIPWTKIRKKLNKAVKNTAKLLNGLVSGVDWKKLGNSVGEGVNTAFGALDIFLTTFDFAAFGTAAADLLNGAVQTTDFTLIGKTLSDKLNAIITTAYAFVTTFDFAGLGSGLGDGVNAWFANTDFAKAGQTLGESIKGVLQTAISFLQTVDWSKVGTSIADFLKNIDWGGIASKAFELLGSALSAAVTLVVTVIKELGGGIADNFKDGFLNGIAETFKDIVGWIKEHIFEPFMRGFKKCFGIHSPSKVMDEQGGLIMAGLMRGITSKISGVISKFKTLLKKIKEVFVSVPSWFKTKFAAALTMVKSAFSLSSVKEHFGAIKDKIVEIFGSLKDALKEPLNWLIDLANKVISGINSISIDLPSAVADIVGFDKIGFDIPEIPKLAQGGLATAPTLAMVGDNRNAKADPEVISPLSKLQGLIDGGKMAEAVELLREILELLRGMELTVTGQVDKKTLFDCIVAMNAAYRRRNGKGAFE